MKLTLPEKIQLLRKRMGLNQGQFGAKAFNMSVETGRTKIKNIELGKQKPTAEDLVQMANVLGIPPSALTQVAADGAAPQTLPANGIHVDQAALDRFHQLGPYLEMLNRAVAIKDEELIVHIADKLSDVFAVSSQLEAVNTQLAEAAVYTNDRDYHTMRDQYLELLWAAQKVEDRRLTELILSRLKEMAIEMTISPTPACEIIPFPSIIVQPIGSSEASDVAHPWPRQPLRHLLSIICGYCAVVIFFGLFGLTPA